MENTTILACEIVKKELLHILDEKQIELPIVWLDSGLHDYPKKLHEEIEKAIAGIETKRILLTFGLCGESVIGIEAGEHELILPKSDDCITMLLGSHEQRVKINKETAGYFLTEGWIGGAKTPLSEYEHMVEEYGEDMAEELMDMMYHNYRSLCMLDTGVEDMESFSQRCDEIARISCTEKCVVKGTLEWLAQLVTGQWNVDKFVIKQPGEIIEKEDFSFEV